jgi:hypothetical protein
MKNSKVMFIKGKHGEIFLVVENLCPDYSKGIDVR